MYPEFILHHNYVFVLKKYAMYVMVYMNFICDSEKTESFLTTKNLKLKFLEKLLQIESTARI